MFFLHKVGQFLDAVDTMGYNVHMGYKVQSQVNYMDIRMLQRNASRLKDLIFSRKSCTTTGYDGCINNHTRRYFNIATTTGPIRLKLKVQRASFGFRHNGQFICTIPYPKTPRGKWKEEKTEPIFFES